MCAINTIKETPEQFDFEDGCGPVPAHKHAFGGGWVADTAQVKNSVYVGPCARVYGHASVCGNAKIGGSSEISGYAQIRDNVCIGDKVRVQGYALIEGDIVLEKECFIGAGAHLEGNIKIGDHATFIQTTRCLECPLLRDSYGAVTENPCANCLSAVIKRRNESGAYKNRFRERHPDPVSKDPLVSAFESVNAGRVH